MNAAQSSLAASHLGLIVAFGVVVAMTVTAIAPQQAEIIASMAVTEGVPLAAWLLAAYGFGSLLLRRGDACIAREPERTTDRESTSAGDASVATTVQASSLLATITRIALGLGAISLLTLLLGVTGLLRQPTAIALLAAGDIQAITHIYKHRAINGAWLRGSPGVSWLLVLIAPVFALTVIGTCVLPGVLWGLDDPSGYDVVAYHLQLPREWFDLGRVTTLHHNVFSFFPLNVEMHYLLAMHLRGGPWAGMYLAQMMHGTFVALTVAAVYGAARSRGRLAASVAAIVCAGVPWMFMLGSVAYVEGGLMLYATLAAAWAIRGRWALAGACAGLACGCKLTGVPVAGVLIVAVVIVRGLGSLSSWERVRVRAFDHSKESGPPSGPHPSPLPGGEGEGAVTWRFTMARDLLVFASVAMLVFSPWLIRTAIASGGNPIFPLALHTLGHGHFDAGQVERFEAAHSPRDDQRSLGGRFAALWEQVGGDAHYGAMMFGSTIIPAAWIILALVGLWRVRIDIQSRGEVFIWFLIVLGNVAVWLLATHLQGRFLVQVIPFAAIAIGICASRTTMFFYRRALVVGPRQRHFATITIILTVAGMPLAMRSAMPTLLASRPAIGIEDSTQLREFIPEETARAVYDTDRPIALLGDAKAFWYEIPSSRLHYRSVFDVPSPAGFRDAWLGPDVPADAAVCVDLIELTRFYRTYRRLPDAYYSWDTRPLGNVIRVDDVPR